jgi:hypothetical protein
MRQANMILQTIKIKVKQNKNVPDSNSNLAKSMTHHNRTKKLTTWFLTFHWRSWHNMVFRMVMTKRTRMKERRWARVPPQHCRRARSSLSPTATRSAMYQQMTPRSPLSYAALSCHLLARARSMGGSPLRDAQPRGMHPRRHDGSSSPARPLTAMSIQPCSHNQR